jgi:hypothetical protein
MAEAATTQVTPPNTNGTGTSNSNNQAAPSAKPPPAKNNVAQRDNNNTGGNRGGRQNYNNRGPNNNNNNNPPAGGGGGSNDKNPRRGKRFTRKTNNNNNDGGKASSQGDDNRGPPTAAVNAGINNPQVSSASGNQNVKPSAVPNGVQKSWSNVVSSTYGQPAVQQHNGAEAQAQNQVVKHENANHGQVNNQNHDSNNKRQNRPKKTGNKFEEKKGKPDEADNFNPDEKIQAIQNQLDKTLNDMQAKADRVKQLQEQIKTIRAERDGKIDELNTERANIVEDLKKLNNELSETNLQISTIITTMTQHKTNRIQKVRSLVDHSRSLLNDKAI